MRISIKQYAQILDTSLTHAKSESEFKDLIKEFVEFVSNEGKLSKINDILYYFNTLWNKRHKTIDVIVESADKEGLETPKQIGGLKTNTIVKINPSLIGGTILKIGDYIIDSSISSKINTLRN